jgi:hypothetical protein
MRNGGASTKRSRPSTTSVNFFAAPTLDRFPARLWILAAMSSRSSSTTTLSRSSAVICSYQMSRNRALEHPRFDHGRTLDDTRSKTAEPTGGSVDRGDVRNDAGYRDPWRPGPPDRWERRPARFGTRRALNLLAPEIAW